MNNKTLSKMQWILAVAAVLLVTVLAFLPIISIPLQPNVLLDVAFSPVLNAAQAKEMAEATDPAAVVKKYSDIEKNLIENEVRISVSGVGFVKSLPDTVAFTGAWISSIQLTNLQKNIAEKALSNPDYAGSDSQKQDLKRVQELSEKLASIDPAAVNDTSIGNVRLCLNGVITTVSGAMEQGSVGQEGFGMQVVVAIAFSIIHVGILLIMLILFPIKMLLTVMKLIPALLSKKEGVYSRVMHQSQIMLGWYGVVLGTLAVWGGSFAVAGWLFTVIAVAVLAVNVLASRQKTYTVGEKRFLNLLQLCAAISLAGAALFVICISKADLNGFYTGIDVSNQILGSMGKTEKEGAPRLLLYLVAMCTSIVLVLVLRGVMGMLSRAACMNDPDRDEATGRSLGGIFVGAVLILANAVALRVFDLSLPAGRQGAFAAACVGIVIALAGQVLLPVLRSTRIPDLTAEEMRAVMCGRSVNDAAPAPADETKSDGEETKE